MTIQFMDNFQSYGGVTSFSTPFNEVTPMLQGLPWAAVYGGIAVDPDPSASGYVLRLGCDISSSNTTDTRIALPSVTKKVGVSFRYYFSFLPSESGYRKVLASFRSSTNSRLYDFVIEINGALSLYQQATGTSGYNSAERVATTINPVTAPQSWYHYEFFIDLVNGTYEARIEGTPVLSGTSLPLTNDIYLVGFTPRVSGALPTEGANYMKDFILWDGSGSDNNTFLGTVSVFTLRPNGDVSSGWTRSSGTTDWQILDSQNPVNADYISAGDTPPAPSIVTFTNLPDDVVGVRAVQMMTLAKKSDGGDAVLQNSLLSDGSEDLGATHNVTTLYKYWFDVSELDPSTGLAWDPIGVNDVSMKINRTL